MLNARCYFHFSPVVVNTVVCCFADCYSYYRYKDVLSNKAINQPMHGKAQGVLQKVPKSVWLLLWLNLMCRERDQVGPGFVLHHNQAECGAHREGFTPTMPCPALSLGPWA